MKGFLLLLALTLNTCFYLGQTAVVRSVSNKNLTDEGCICKDFMCNCCVKVVVPQIYLNDSGCVMVALDVKDYGFSVSLTIDSYVIINETMSARNPPPICIAIPELKSFFHLCLRFTHLNVSSQGFSGCAGLDFRMAHLIVLQEISLGCWNTLGSSTPLSIPRVEPSQAVVWVKNSSLVLESFLKKRISDSELFFGNLQTYLMQNASYVVQQKVHDIVNGVKMNTTQLQNWSKNASTFFQKQFQSIQTSAVSTGQNWSKIASTFFQKQFQSIQTSAVSNISSGFDKAKHFFTSDVANGISSGFDKVNHFFTSDVTNFFRGNKSKTEDVVMQPPVQQHATENKSSSSYITQTIISVLAVVAIASLGFCSVFYYRKWKNPIHYRRF